MYICSIFLDGENNEMCIVRTCKKEYIASAVPVFRLIYRNPDLHTNCDPVAPRHINWLL